jgi:hypothetical protein
MTLGLQYVGSFQNQRLVFHTEDPLSEVWNHIERYGTAFAKRNSKPINHNVNWDDYVEYAQIRTKQALEFRKASSDASLLTAPALLYYSFLHLTRAFLALGHEVMPKPGHGLQFVSAPRLLQSSACVSSGTFAEYMESQNATLGKDAKISLAEALGFIVEFAMDYWMFDQSHVYVEPVAVEALIHGTVHLRFPRYSGDFVASWEQDFPKLADVCELADDRRLIVKDTSAGRNHEAIQEFLDERLLPSLVLRTDAMWYALRRNNAVIKLPRSAYYYVAMFILGSAVRYQPELILSVCETDSEVGWLLQKFLRLAERFFPQLKLLELYDSQIYFSSGGGL